MQEDCLEVWKMWFIRKGWKQHCYLNWIRDDLGDKMILEGFKGNCSDEEIELPCVFLGLGNR